MGYKTHHEHAADATDSGNSLSFMAILDMIKEMPGPPSYDIRPGGSILSSVNIIGSRIVFGANDGNIYCISLKDGRQVWKTKAGGGC